MRSRWRSPTFSPRSATPRTASATPPKWATREVRSGAAHTPPVTARSLVDDAGAIKASHHRYPPADLGRLKVADFLHPPQVQLDLRAAHGQRFDTAFATPHQVGAKVGLGMDPGLIAVASQIGRNRFHKRISGRVEDNREQDKIRTGHTQFCAAQPRNGEHRAP